MSSSYEIKKKKHQSNLFLNCINKFNEIPKFSEKDQIKDKNEVTFILNKSSNITSKNSKNILNSANKNKNYLNCSDLNKETIPK